MYGASRFTLGLILINLQAFPIQKQSIFISICCLMLLWMVVWNFLGPFSVPKTILLKPSGRLMGGLLAPSGREDAPKGRQVGPRRPKSRQGSPNAPQGATKPPQSFPNQHLTRLLKAFQATNWPRRGARSVYKMLHIKIKNGGRLFFIAEGRKHVCASVCVCV
jgi:hypothetical protein